MKSFVRQAASVMLSYLCIAHVHAQDVRPTVEQSRIVAAVWIQPGSAGGKEVVIQPDVDKLKAYGLTLEQFAKSLRGVRFVMGKWDIEIGRKVVNLENVARLTVRETQAKPFAVKLGDGRKVLVNPDSKRVSQYVITGEEFESIVRQNLSDFRGPDPAKCYVLSMILVPGSVGPHLTEKSTGKHFSLGEPLHIFADVEVRPKEPTAESKDRRP